MKLRSTLLLCIIIGIQLSLLSFSHAQNIKSYSLPFNPEIDKLHVSMIATSGKSTVKPSLSTNFVNIYSKSRELGRSSQFESYVRSSDQYISLKLNEQEPRSLSQTISQKVFYGKPTDEDPIWNVYLTPYKKIALNLNYNLGTANIDLSGLAVTSLKINTGSADVHVGFPSEMNQLEMDTFSVKVDLGTLHIENGNFFRAKQVNVEVGFGKLILELQGAPTTSSSYHVNVGAGRLEVLLPDNQHPTIIYLNKSPLCHINVDKSFRKISTNAFVNEAYEPDAPNLTTFHVDVALGNIGFIKK